MLSGNKRAHILYFIHEYTLLILGRARFGMLSHSGVPSNVFDLGIDGCRNRCNLGYAFVNFTTVEATKRLYKAFHAQQWEAFNSRKICQVTYARVQVCSHIILLVNLH